MKKIDEINQKKIIKDIILDEIKNTPKSQIEIVDYISRKFGIEISRHTIAHIAKDVLTEKDYEKRFPIYEKASMETIALIIELINTTEKSLHKIAEHILKELNIKISIDTIQRIARKVLTEEAYKKRFLISKIDDEIRAAVIELIRSSNKSQREIAAYVSSEFGVKISRTSIQNISREVLTEEELQKRFPQLDGAILGMRFHKKVTKDLKNWGEKRGIKVLQKREIQEKIPRFKEIGKRPDNVIFVNENLRKACPIPSHVKYIALDF